MKESTNRKLNVRNYLDIKLEQDKMVVSSDPTAMDQYFCPIVGCSKVPYFENIDFKNNEIKMACKFHSEVKKQKIDEFIKYMSKNTYFLNTKCQGKYCEKKENYQSHSNTIFYYCYDCNLKLCPDCQRKDHSSHSFKPINEYCTKCPKHKGMEYLQYCKECKEDLCPSCLKEEEKKHIAHSDKIKIIFGLNEEEIRKLDKFMKDLNKKRSKLLQELKKEEDRLCLIELLKTTYEKNKYNYCHVKNCKTLISDYEYFLEQQRYILPPDISNNALIEAFNKEYKTTLKAEDQSAELSEKDIKDQGLEKFVKINFPFLRNIFLGEDNISNIKYLCEKKYNELKIIDFENNE